MRPHPRTNPHRRGFTLIELIVVIVILGILVAVAAFAYNSVISNSRQDSVRKTAAQIAASLQGYSATKQAPYGAATFGQAVVDGIVDGDTDATVSAMTDDVANGYATVTVTRDGYSVEVHCPLGKVGVACRTGTGGSSGGGPVPPVVDAAIRAVAVASAGGSLGFDSVTMLPDGSAIVTGNASGTVTFGTHTVTTASTSWADADIVVAKLNPDGTTWAWATTAGGTGFDITRDAVADGSGGIYLTGDVADATFGSLPGTQHGLFVAKLTGSGTWAWVTSVATQEAGPRATGTGVATAPNGDIVVAGYFSGTATFGSDTFSDTGHDEIVVARLSSSGNWLWARRGQSSDQDVSTDVAVDGSGNIYIAGTFKGSSQFGSHQVTGTGTYDAVVAKLDATGNWLWATAAGGTGENSLDALAVDPAGKLVVSGHLTGNGTFGSTPVTADSSGDVVVAKVNPATGQPIWVTTGGGDGWDGTYCLTLDGSGNIVIGAYTDSSAGTYGALTLAGSGYTLVAKLTPAGDWSWVRRAGGNSYDDADGIQIRADGSVLVAGAFYDNATFGPTTLTDGGQGSGYLAWWDADGTQD